MKQLTITSIESLDAAVAHAVQLKINRTQLNAKMDAEIAGIQKAYAPRLATSAEAIGVAETEIHDYCAANRAAVFPEIKSRATAAGNYGFELTPPRVETASKKITWKDVVARLGRLTWGKAYVRQPEPKPDKEALLTDREKLTTEQITSAGIQFCQDEQFFIRPNAETAEATQRAA